MRSLKLNGKKRAVYNLGLKCIERLAIIMTKSVNEALKLLISKSEEMLKELEEMGEEVIYD